MRRIEAKGAPRVRGLVCLSLISIALYGCTEGEQTTTSVEVPEGAHFVLTFDGPHGNCIVALDKNIHGTRVPCREVVSYLRDSPRVTAESRFDLITISDVNAEEYEEVMAALKQAGYRQAATTKIGFLNWVEPERSAAGKSPAGAAFGIVAGSGTTSLKREQLTNYCAAARAQLGYDALDPGSLAATALYVPARLSIAMGRKVRAASTRLAMEGTVLLGLVVNSVGSTAHVQVLEKSEYQTLDNEAMAIFMNAEFKPATLDGAPIRACMLLRVRFKETD